MNSSLQFSGIHGFKSRNDFSQLRQPSDLPIRAERSGLPTCSLLGQFPKRFLQSSLQEETHPRPLPHGALSQCAPPGLNPTFLFTLICQAHLVSLSSFRFYKAPAKFFGCSLQNVLPGQRIFICYHFLEMDLQL